MTHIEDYCAQNNISKRTAYRMVIRGEISAVKLNGLTYVIHHNKPESFNPERAEEIAREKKARFDKAILTAKKKISHSPNEASEIRNTLIKEIESEIQVLEKAGVKITGYNAKSIYRKLKKDRLDRKTRADRFAVKNDILSRAEVRRKIYQSAVSIYFENAASNFSILADLILARATREEELYEVAAIPRSTLYSFLKNDFENSGYKTVHSYINHFNLFKKTLPKVAGAFTDDIGFFDYIIGDDHKLDVSAVLVWDEASRKWVHKQVKIWLWIEAKTMFPLGWEIKVGDFKVNDLKESLTRVFLQWGLPKQSIVVDNGIGRGAEFKDFLSRVGLGIEQLQFSAAYDPTNKAPGERAFGFIKNEFDVFFSNFVGPDKETEARHHSEKLSPEETLETLTSYRNKLENYLTGFYIERIRSRKISGITRKLSVKEFFDTEYLTHTKIECNKHKLRYAFGKEKDIKYNGEVTVAGEKYQTTSALPLGWYGKKFRILYNTADLSEVDMYAIDDLLDETGNMIEKGSYLCTLYCVRTHPNKNELIRGLKKSILKNAKKMAGEIIALKDANKNETEKYMPFSVANNGELHNEHKEAKKQAEIELQQVVDKIEINTNIQTAPEETAYSIQQSDDPDEGYSLTYEEDDDER